METVSDFTFLGFKITADGDCSHEIKRHILLGRKVNDHLESILKSRDITREGNGNALQYSGLENPMDRGDWWAEVHGVTKSQT